MLHMYNFIIHSKNREPQWSSDEKICGLLNGANVLLYEDNNFDRYIHKINVAKVAKFSIAPGNAPNHILCYMPGNYIYLYNIKIIITIVICKLRY